MIAVFSLKFFSITDFTTTTKILKKTQNYQLVFSYNLLIRFTQWPLPTHVSVLVTASVFSPAPAALSALILLIFIIHAPAPILTPDFDLTLLLPLILLFMYSTLFSRVSSSLLASRAPSLPPLPPS